MAEFETFDLGRLIVAFDEDIKALATLATPRRPYDENNVELGRRRLPSEGTE